MHLRLYKNVNAEIQEEWNAIVEILKQCNYDEDVYKNVLDAVEEYFRTLVQRKRRISCLSWNALWLKCMKKMDDVKRQKSQRSALLIYIIVGT